MYTTYITAIPAKEEGPSSLAKCRNNTKVINKSTEEQ